MISVKERKSVNRRQENSRIENTDALTDKLTDITWNGLTKHRRKLAQKERSKRKTEERKRSSPMNSHIQQTSKRERDRETDRIRWTPWFGQWWMRSSGRKGKKGRKRKGMKRNHRKRDGDETRGTETRRRSRNPCSRLPWNSFFQLPSQFSFHSFTFCLLFLSSSFSLLHSLLTSGKQSLPVSKNLSLSYPTNTKQRTRRRWQDKKRHKKHMLELPQNFLLGFPCLSFCINETEVNQSSEFFWKPESKLKLGKSVEENSGNRSIVSFFHTFFDMSFAFSSTVNLFFSSLKSKKSMTQYMLQTISFFINTWVERERKKEREVKQI